MCPRPAWFLERVRGLTFLGMCNDGMSYSARGHDSGFSDNKANCHPLGKLSIRASIEQQLINVWKPSLQEGRI